MDAPIDLPNTNKRRTLVCMQCTRRKVKCDKKVPCTNCIRRKVPHECRRPTSLPETGFGPLKRHKSQPPTHWMSKFDTKAPAGTTKTENPVPNPPTESQLTEVPFFSSANIEHYLFSLRSLTFGATQIEGLLPMDELSTQSNKNRDVNHVMLEHLIPRLTIETSQIICNYACHYTTPLHHGIIPALFMKDHDTFWTTQAAVDSTCLLYFKDHSLKAESSRDYYYWLSLLYAVLSTGIQFGGDSFKSLLPYTESELSEFPRVLFRSSLDCLLRAGCLEKPDIRTIQIYSVMTMCFKALGSFQLNKSLLRIAVDTAKSLRLDVIEDDPNGAVNFQKEVSKRIWYTVFIVDSLSNYPNRMITSTTTPFPLLLTTDQLMGKAPRTDASLLEVCQNDEISGIAYHILMAEMAQIKHESFEGASTEALVTRSWYKMSQLRNKLDMYFGPERYGKDEKSIAQYARYLLFSSITRESLDMGVRLLSIIGVERWEADYRRDCLKLAMELLTHSTNSNIPLFYNKYWIVVQHLIYACLFVLLDLLMFKSEEDESVLESVKKAIPTIETLRKSFFTAKVGLAVVEKLTYLASCVRLKQKGIGTIEDISLRGFLRELEIANPFNSRAGANSITPSVNEPQYFRLGKKAEVTYPEHIALNEELDSFARYFLDPNVDQLLDDTGWVEFLDFFFSVQQPYPYDF